MRELQLWKKTAVVALRTVKEIYAISNFTRQQFLLELKRKFEILNFLHIADTIAFHVVLTSYDTISTGSAILFNEILLNEGEG